jgi:hypothetical protein
MATPKDSPITSKSLPSSSLSNCRISFAHRESGTTQKRNTFSPHPHNCPTRVDCSMATPPKDSPITSKSLPNSSLCNCRNSFAHRESRKTQRRNTFSPHPHNFATRVDCSMATPPKDSLITSKSLPNSSLCNCRNSFAHRESRKTQRRNTFSPHPQQEHRQLKAPLVHVLLPWWCLHMLPSSSKNALSLSH